MNFRTTAIPLWLTLLPASAIAQPIPAAANEQNAANGNAPTVPAQTPVPPIEPVDSHAREEARDRFAAGIKLYDDGEFALALIEFDRAYSIVPDYRVLYNIGQVNIQLGRYARAARALKQFLKEGGDRILEDRKQSVLNDLSMLSGRTATISVATNVPGAEVLLDSDVVAITPMPAPLLVDAGEHRLTVRKLGYTLQTKPVALAGRDELSLEFALAVEPKAITTEKTVIVERKVAPDRPADRRSLYVLLGWTGTAALGASWATIGYFGYAASKDRSEAASRKTSAQELSNLESRTRHFYLASDILGATTLLAAGGMLYYTLVSPPRAKEPERKAVGISRLAFQAGPSQVFIAGQF